MFKDRKPPKLLIESTISQLKSDLLPSKTFSERPLDKRASKITNIPNNDNPEARSQSPNTATAVKSRNSFVVLNHILHFLNKEDMFIDSKTFKSIVQSVNLQNTVNKLKNDTPIKPTMLHKGQVAPKDPHQVKKKVVLRPLAGKMYANELWSKKQYQQMATISPAAAKRDAMRKLGLETEPNQPTGRTTTRLKSHRILRNSITDDLISRFQNGSTMDEGSSVLEQVVARMKQSSIDEIPTLRTYQSSPRKNWPSQNQSPMLRSRKISGLYEPDAVRYASISPGVSKKESLLLKKRVKETENQYFEPKSPETSKFKHSLQDLCLAKKEEPEKVGSMIPSTVLSQSTPDHMKASSMRKRLDKAKTSRPKLNKLAIKVKSSQRILTTEDSDQGGISNSQTPYLYSRVSPKLNESAHNQLDSLIDECDRFSNDQSLHKMILKMSSEINSNTNPEIEKKKKEKRAIASKQSFIEGYKTLLRIRNSDKQL